MYSEQNSCAQFKHRKNVDSLECVHKVVLCPVQMQNKVFHLSASAVQEGCLRNNTGLQAISLHYLILDALLVRKWKCPAKMNSETLPDQKSHSRLLC